jgi:hypothetical protein
MDEVRRATRALGRIASRLLSVVHEIDYWQRRAAVLTMAPDRYS